MPSHERGKLLLLEDQGQAATLVCDPRLILAHVAYLVSILGSVRWLVTRRYDRRRPHAEMKLSLSGSDVLSTVTVVILSFPLGGRSDWVCAPRAGRVQAGRRGRRACRAGPRRRDLSLPLALHPVGAAARAGRAHR